jgi:hypothetical protein
VGKSKLRGVLFSENASVLLDDRAYHSIGQRRGGLIMRITERWHAMTVITAEVAICPSYQTGHLFSDNYPNEKSMSRIERIIIGISMIGGRYRALLGFCPMCNSDAPELYDCPLCEGYQQARGDKFPPPKSLRKEWLDEYRGMKVMKRKIARIVRDSRRNNTAS